MLSPHRLRSSLRAKVTFAVVLPLILMLTIFITVQHVQHRRVVLSDVSLLAAYSGQVLEANLRHSMLNSDFAEVQALLDAIGESERFRVVYVMDTTGRIIFSPNGQDVGLRLDNSEPDCQPCHRLPGAERPASAVTTTSDGQRIFRSMQPIRNDPECAQCHGTEDRLRGLVLTDISMAPLEASVQAHLRNSLLWSIGIVLGTTLLVNVVVSRFVLSRLERVAAAIAGFGQGRLLAPIPEMEPDEIGQLSSAFNLMAKQVKTREAENRALSENLRSQSALRGRLLKRLTTAQEDERRRIARELHDELGQILSGLAFRAEAMETLIESAPERAREQLEPIRQLASQATRRMYGLILDLRPSVLDDLGLAAALRVYAERLLVDTGITFNLNTDELTARLPPEVETTLYRLYQEALSNVMRHAGAKQVTIRLAQNGDVFEGEISDDGQGFDPEMMRVDGHSPRGLGLLGMQERVEQCAGQLEVISRRGGGTLIRIRIPLTEANNG